MSDPRLILSSPRQPDKEITGNNDSSHLRHNTALIAEIISVEFVWWCTIQ